MKQRSFVYLTLFLLFFPGTPHLAGAVVEPETIEGRPGERIRLGDPQQERRMSSTNWPGEDRVSDDSRGETENRLEEKAHSNPNEQRPLRVFLDPGHGGKDTGAHGYYGVNEARVSLRTAQKVQTELLRAARLRHIELEIMLSRQSDDYLSLKERYLAANTWEADVFVSIHGNSSPAPKARGFEVYFLSPFASDEATRKTASKENAQETKRESLVNSILADTRTSFHVRESSLLAVTVFTAMSRFIRPNVRAVRQGPFTVLAGTEMPAVLVEVGYLSQPGEAQLLGRDSYLNRIAGAISAGIMDYFVSTKRLLGRNQKDRNQSLSETDAAHAVKTSKR